jgi:tetratricopeptide (TPR) repeat protein
VDWSYQLLSEVERILFARLSVFAGGFTLKAAEAVCAGEGIEASDVADLVDGLVAKSLVVPGAARYWILDTIRAYGSDRLRALRSSDEYRARHAAFYATFSTEAKAGMRGVEESDWSRRVDAELGNVRSALEWGLELNQEAGLTVLVGLARWWDVRGHWTEGRHWLGRYLSPGRSVPPLLRANALVFLGNLLRMQGELAGAREALSDALLLARHAGDAACAASALNSLGNVAAVSGDHDAAKRHYEECLELREQQGERGSQAITLANLGAVAMAQGRYADCETRLSQAAVLARGLGELYALSNALTGLGNVAAILGDYALAKARFTEALSLKAELGDRFGIANSQMNLGVVAADTGDYDDALTCYQQALSAFRELGERSAVAKVLNNLGGLAAEAGDLESARDYHIQALALRQEIGEKGGVAISLGQLGTVMLEMGDVEAADRLCAQCLDTQLELGDRRGAMLAHLQMGDVLTAQSRLGDARTHFICAVHLAVELGEPRPLASALLALGQAAQAAGDPERAARLMAAAETRARAIGVELSPSRCGRHERDVTAMRDEVGESAFASAWAEGEAMTLEEAVAFALGEGSDV